MVKNRKLLNEELGRKSIDEFKSSEKLPIAVVLDNVRSLNNVGSVFRTSDAFLVEKIYLCGITGTPPHPEIHRSALGAENSVDWEYADSTVKAVEGLKQLGYVIVSVEQVEHSVLLNQFYPTKGQKYALVFGNEVKGVGQDVVDISDVCIEIPQLGTKHSFNISVSAGIVLWDFFVKVMVD
ncbi:RNA methyltransferase [Tenuifilum osseticum]|uniref:RNA methyltransferase n=1 Tax=Tenuifilum osseticum TaxID=3374723 RepID=UPI0034E6139D